MQRKAPENSFDKESWRRRNAEFLRGTGVLRKVRGIRPTYVELAGKSVMESYKTMVEMGLVSDGSFIAVDRNSEVVLSLACPEEGSRHPFRVVSQQDAVSYALDLVARGESPGAFNYDSYTTADNAGVLGHVLENIRIMALGAVRKRGDFALIMNVELVGTVSRVDAHRAKTVDKDAVARKTAREFFAMVRGFVPSVTGDAVPSDEEIDALSPEKIEKGGWTSLGRSAEAYRSSGLHRKSVMLTWRHHFTREKSGSAEKAGGARRSR